MSIPKNRPTAEWLGAFQKELINNDISDDLIPDMLMMALKYELDAVGLCVAEGSFDE